jgi:hypothetical protein
VACGARGRPSRTNSRSSAAASASSISLRVRPSRVTTSGCSATSSRTPGDADLCGLAAVVLDRPQGRPGEQVADD